MNFLKLIMLLSFFFIQLASAENLVSSVDRFRIGEDETITLTITYDDANVSGQPNLSGLENNFDILNSSSSSETRIINGNISSTKKWRYSLTPKLTGKLLIPSFYLKDSYSEPIEIEVVDSATLDSITPDNRGDLFIEATVNKQEAYVQEIIILTFRIYTSVQIAKPKLPELTLPGLMIEKIGENQFETREADRNYYVLEYRYALFSHQSGELIIPKQRYQISQIISNGPRSLFDIRNFGAQTQARFLSTKDIPLQIKPAPTHNPASYWLASDDVSLIDNWPEEQTIEPGTPITRNIEIRALGNLAANIPPLADNIPTQLKSYREQPILANNRAGETLLATRIENTAIVAIEPGLYTLPEIQLHWWSNKEKRFKVSTLPERHIKVQASTIDSSHLPPISTANPDAKTTQILPAPVTDPVTRTPFYLNAYVWMWVSLALLAALLYVLFILFNQNKSVASVENSQLSSRKYSEKNYFVQLKNACKCNDAKNTRLALIQWANAKWENDNISTSSDLKRKLNSEEFNSLIDELYSNIYKNMKPWNGKPLLDYLNSENFLSELNVGTEKNKLNMLPDLYS